MTKYHQQLAYSSTTRGWGSTLYVNFIFSKPEGVSSTMIKVEIEKDNHLQMRKVLDV